jgi:protein SCO1
MIKALLLAICFCLCICRCPADEKKHSAEGMVVEIDKKTSSIVISCEAIPDYMEAMEMLFKVRDVAVLDGLRAGVIVQFTLVEGGSHVFADNIRVVKRINGEAEPVEAARLGYLSRAVDPAAEKIKVQVGQVVPDFALLDQQHRMIHLSQFKAKVVALTFGYSRCPNPDYCFRLSNNLAQLQRRFPGPSGNDLVLLTILIDPSDQQRSDLGSYAKTWKADPAKWHFLTGPIEQVRNVAALFGMDFWDEEGFLTHPFHTAVIDRDGRLVANLEGNQFTSKELGDLVQRILNEQADAGLRSQ